MDINLPLQLLAGLSSSQFMARHWQKKPLLVRRAIVGFKPLLSRPQLFDLASNEGVESRFLSQSKDGWKLRHGPFVRRSLPPLSRPNWTLLVQGVDLYNEAVHALMQQFRFVPDARLDDVMISYATDGGGVGPHFDSYDVFLLQAHGQRRWRIGRQKDLSLVPDLPLKNLSHFEPEEEYVLEPGDMLYLPPCWAHDGVAVGECMTYSIGFRQPVRSELVQELLQRLADEAAEDVGEVPYRDPGQKATTTPALLPDSIRAFAHDAVARALKDSSKLDMLLGELMTEPKPNIWFESLGEEVSVTGKVVLDRRTRMLYDSRHIFINGESYRASGRDAQLMRRLAGARTLSAQQVAALSVEAKELLNDWLQAGWVHGR